MKAKACVRCRQSKIRCDSDVRAPNACSRCHSINKQCLVDCNFRAKTQRKRLLELEAEIRRLCDGQSAGPEIQSSPAAYVQQQHQNQQVFEHPREQQSLQQSENSSKPLISSIKTIGSVRFTAAQVDEVFRVYFAHCHPYLDFRISTCPQTVYEKCTLLFWVICAVASASHIQQELQPEIQAMVGQIVLNPIRSVEAVQALIILCMWPFPFYSTLGDPSLIYCGLATQMALQIGLHRPGLSQEFSSRRQVLEVGYDERKTTWMACYVVNQMQAGRLGVPVTIQADFTFLRSLEMPGISPILVALCRISRLTVQFTTTIGANGQNLSGLLDPATRIDMVRLFSSELDSLQSNCFPDMSSAVHISFLTSRLQLWSFILHDDVLNSTDIIDLVYRAEKDAADLIHRASAMNLARCPFHVARSVLYSAVTLLKILSSPHAKKLDVIKDQIQLARQTLLSAIKIEDDHAERWSRHLEELLHLKDKKGTPPIRSRMAASVMYDAIRILKENRMGSASNEIQASSTGQCSSFPAWIGVEPGFDMLDFDGMNWDDIGGLL